MITITCYSFQKVINILVLFPYVKAKIHLPKSLKNNFAEKPRYLQYFDSGILFAKAKQQEKYYSIL